MIKKILLIFLISSMILSISGCGGVLDFSKRSMTGDKNVLGRTYQMTDGESYSVVIKDINIDKDSARIVYNEALPSELVVTTDENIFESFEITVNDETHEITVTGDGTYKYVPSEFEITVGGLVKSIDIRGRYEVDLKYAAAESVGIAVSGAVSGHVSLDGVENADINIEGACDLEFEGNVERFTAEITGAGKINGYKLLTSITDIAASGASIIEITVSEELNADVVGTAIVKYKGEGVVNRKNISGLGELIHAED